jgi:uncharacterized protein (TIGR02284 family)
MSKRDIKVLNSVTKTLIDSCQGYETCCEVTDDDYSLQQEFKRREQERRDLVAEIQMHVRKIGGDPEEEGSMAGAVHRGFTRFSSLFRDDEKAAISALDDGEEHLAEKIEDKLEDDDLLPQTRSLLQKAYTSAKSGESFAEMLD